MKLSVVFIQPVLILFDSLVEAGRTNRLLVAKGNESSEVIYESRTKAYHDI